MNKSVYITGGSKGIGYGIAKILLENGCKVAISGRNEADVQIAERKLSKISEDIIGIVSDVTKFGDEERAISMITEKFGGLGVLVANAGVGIFKPVDELTLDDWNAMINTNLTGIFHMVLQHGK